jgi:hypothetical protein
MSGQAAREYDQTMEYFTSVAREGQQYVALVDRQARAERSYFPFAMPWIFKFLAVNIKDLLNIEACAGCMLARPAIQDVMSQVKIFGHNNNMTPKQANTSNDAT